MIKSAARVLFISGCTLTSCKEQKRGIGRTKEEEDRGGGGKLEEEEDPGGGERTEEEGEDPGARTGREDRGGGRGSRRRKGRTLEGDHTSRRKIEQEDRGGEDPGGGRRTQEEGENPGGEDPGGGKGGPRRGPYKQEKNRRGGQRKRQGGACILLKLVPHGCILRGHTGNEFRNGMTTQPLSGNI